MNFRYLVKVVLSLFIVTRISFAISRYADPYFGLFVFVLLTALILKHHLIRCCVCNSWITTKVRVYDKYLETHKICRLCRACKKSELTKYVES